MPETTSRPRVSVTEAAASQGVSPKTIRNWITTGHLTGYRVGPKLIRIDLDELDALARPIGGAV
jgi:excisionase family DNA binding protein